MKAITHYEVYVVKLGRWALQARLSQGEQNQALDMARTLEVDTNRATQVLEESLEPELERLTIRVVGQYGTAPPETKGPSTDTDIASRIFMVVVNAFGIGAIATMVLAIMLSSFRESGAAAGSSFNMLLLFTFAAVMLMSGLTLFKIYVPMEWVLWRGKGKESQRRTIETLLYGARDPAPAPSWLPPSQTYGPPTETAPTPETAVPADLSLAAVPQDIPQSVIPQQRLETNADQGEQTSFQIIAPPTAEEAAAAGMAPPAESLLDAAAHIMESLLEKESAQLIAFADNAMSALAATRPQLQSFERVGLNLYLAGAAAAVAERAGFADSIALNLLTKALVHTGTHPAVADAFGQRLGASSQRPRFRKLMEGGHAAMMATMDGGSNSPLPPLPDLITQWADPTVRGAEVKKVTFLLTDIVGSTALTSKMGNSAAQRVVRAHNSAARAAIKNFRGTEVKHTGDGMLITFPDGAAAGRAAMEIQQEGTSYARDNPDAPLVMRLGIHTGEASVEEGEYYGPALSILNGICAAAGDDQIFCTEEVKSKCVGPVFRFQDMGMRTLKGSQLQCRAFKLEWTPKMKAPKGPVEYKQIGKKKPAEALL